MLAMIAGLSACGGTTSFHTFDGNPRVVNGTGGFLDEEFEGVRIYHSGLPNNTRCQLLGLIKDSRNSDVDGQMFKTSQLTEKAKQNGANVLVLSDSYSEVTGVHNTGGGYVNTGYVSSGSSFVERQEYRLFDAFHCE